MTEEELQTCILFDITKNELEAKWNEGDII